MKKLMAICLVALLAIGLVACTNDNSNNQNENKDQSENMDGMDHGDMNHEEGSGTSNSSSDVTSTKNVTRLDAANLVDAAVKVSNTVWPATHDENKPGAVILAPTDNWQISLAATTLIHHPNNGPVLFYEDDEIPEATLAELERLAPTGNVDGTEVMVVGNPSKKVLDQLDDFSVEQIKGDDPAEFAKAADQKYADVSGGLPQGLIIVSSEEEAKLFSLIAGNWIAHMPEPVLYVTKDGIPDATREALELRNNNANIYVLGPESAISNDIFNDLNEYGNVTRIEGETPAAASIAFARFKDENTGFGWGLTEPGHGLGFVSTKSADYAIAGAPFAHLGKHAPMIWLEDGELTEETHEFLGQLQPKFTDDPTVGPYNHAFIIGSGKEVTMENQGMIDMMLEIVSADGGGHGGH
ncbi:ArsR family transcriptional regulator [Bacillus sp. V3-13]|uniref:ArsR family transcriptional regulator n=1 Tax=Bacillus sp. V3-13 TaxID=2053728 RepID=UPI000C76E1D7|nr:ArsR family transcriptional regulator [Bacillus sp. V3-13]PLR75579.1 ArsR family transcriptional regulator [Bacillus sp. V3-13]